VPPPSAISQANFKSCSTRRRERSRGSARKARLWVTLNVLAAGVKSRQCTKARHSRRIGAGRIRLARFRKRPPTRTAYSSAPEASTARSAGSPAPAACGGRKLYIKPVIFLAGQYQHGFAKRTLDGTQGLLVCLFFFGAALRVDEAVEVSFQWHQCFAKAP